MSRSPLRAARLAASAVLLSAAATGCSADADPGAASASARSSSATSSPAATTAVTSEATSTKAAKGLLLPGRIVFRRYADASRTSASLFTAASDGTNERRLTPSRPHVDDEDPVWSPDGKSVLFTRFVNQDTEHETSGLMTMAADGSRPTYLTHGGGDGGTTVTGIDYPAVYSPDGSRIAYGHGEGKITKGELQYVDIWTMDPDGGNKLNLTHGAPYSGDRGGVAWSPDGKRLVFSRWMSSYGKHAGGMALFVMNVDGTGMHRLTPWPLGAGGTPDWSARSDTIVFRAVQDEETGIGNFFTIRPDGSGLTQLTHFQDTVISHKVGFSPDGRWIVFGRTGVDGQNDIYLAAADGTREHPVTATSLAEGGADWGPRA
jgi:Tol biopolymer transport system component